MVLGKNFHPETRLEQMYGIQSEERKWRHDLVPIIRWKYHTWKGNMIITTQFIQIAKNVEYMLFHPFNFWP